MNTFLTEDEIKAVSRIRLARGNYIMQAVDDAPEVVLCLAELRERYGYWRNFTLSDALKWFRDLIVEQGGSVIHDRSIAQQRDFIGSLAGPTCEVYYQVQGQLRWAYVTPVQGDVDSFGEKVLITTTPLDEERFLELNERVDGPLQRLKDDAMRSMMKRDDEAWGMFSVNQSDCRVTGILMELANPEISSTAVKERFCAGKKLAIEQLNAKCAALSRQGTVSGPDISFQYSDAGHFASNSRHDLVFDVTGVVEAAIPTLWRESFAARYHKSGMDGAACLSKLLEFTAQKYSAIPDNPFAQRDAWLCGLRENPGPYGAQIRRDSYYNSGWKPISIDAVVQQAGEVFDRNLDALRAIAVRVREESEKIRGEMQSAPLPSGFVSKGHSKKS